MVCSSLCQPTLTYLGSFLEQGDHHRCVSAAHRPVERTHPAVVYVLNHCPVVDQELHLKGRKNVVRIVWEVLNKQLDVVYVFCRLHLEFIT